MPKNAETALSTWGFSLSSLATALVLVLGTTVSVQAGTGLPGKAPAQAGAQLAAQQLKIQPRPSGPGRPTLPKRVIANPGGGTATMGCHDHASQTSYEGPCDHYPEYEATGGCESSAEQASLPGNCPNSSEP